MRKYTIDEKCVDGYNYGRTNDGDKEQKSDRYSLMYGVGILESVVA